MARSGHAAAALDARGGARHAAFPQGLEPELATLADQVPEGEDWLHEMKFDGYRMIARRRGDDVRMLTRRGLDWTHRMTSVAELVARLPAATALLDGELVVLRPNGITDFQLLQNSLRDGAEHRLVYCPFDLLYLDGFDLRAMPLLRRKALLEELLRKSANEPRLRYSEHVIGHGREFFEHACALGLEGVVSKRGSSTYRSGRGKDWLKIKCAHRQEFVIGGFTEPSGGRAHLGALLLGTFDEHRGLVYRGKVGTGFTQRSLQELHERLAPLEQNAATFANPPRGSEARGVHWVRPKLVAEVRYTEATTDGMLRHPTFQGVREDKSVREVHLERPVTAPRAGNRDEHGSIAGIRLTHPDRVVFPEQGITKRELAEYYARVGDWMLPHVTGRPLTLYRCPEGRAARCFYQKQPMPGMPDAIRPVRVLDKEKGKEVDNTAVYDVSGIVALVQMGVLEVHTWGARADRPDRPDRVIFDLDPGPGVAWDRVVEGALLLRHALTELGLESFAKTTGGKGLHVVVPVQRRLDWDTTKRFSKAVADLLVRTAPATYLTVSTKAKRQGKVYIDYLRNGYGSTSVCAFSTRARPGAPVSVPVGWDEITRVRPDQYTIANVFERLHALVEDPWRDFFVIRQAVSAHALRRLKVD